MRLIDADKLIEEIMLNFRECESSCHNYSYSDVEHIYDSICDLAETQPTINQ